MVWLHGGGNRLGAGSQAGYNVESFARAGVILVTINYRLGNFGFFAHPVITADAGSGPATNFGVLDQIAALRWVQKNIARFGGDPGRVTVFGESAGGSDIIALLSLPYARSLFSAAIVESGGGTVLGTLADAEADGVKASIELGLGPNPTAAQLRAFPAEQLTLAGGLRQPKPGYGPVVDGRLLQDSPLAVLRQRGLPVPLIIGTNSDEGILAVLYGTPPADMIAYLGGDRALIREAYADLQDDPKDFARTLYRDMKFAVPARSVASLGSARFPAWLYRFDFVPAEKRSEGTGVPHGGELGYVFGVARQGFFELARSAVPPEPTAAERAVATGVNNCWIAFAKTRDPATARYCRGWNPYHSGQGTLVFGDAPSMMIVDKARLDALDAAGSQPGPTR